MQDLTLKIDWKIKVTVDSSDPLHPKYSIDGDHDGFPAYEIYIGDQCVYSYDPIPAGEGVTALAGGLDKHAHRSGEITEEVIPCSN